MMRLGSLVLILLSNSLFANELSSAHVKLNSKTDYCLGLQSEGMNAVDNEWLSSLSDFDLKVTLLELNRLAMTRCVQVEFKDYTYQLFQASIQLGDIKPMKVWFDLNYRSQPEEFKSSKKKLADEIKNLSKLDAFYLPFDTKKYYEAIRKVK
ncbi:hypothetical protein [Vibrio atlanticus]|nr:hypothetical protein [Vibrio atlanticus]